MKFLMEMRKDMLIAIFFFLILVCLAFIFWKVKNWNTGLFWIAFQKEENLLM